MMPAMRRPLRTALALMVALPTGAVAADADRPAGATFTWGHELRQAKLPNFKKNKPVPYGRTAWANIVNQLLSVAGQNGLWYSGSVALPFDLPLPAYEPRWSWFTRANYDRLHRATGIRFDVHLELRLAQLAKDRNWHQLWNTRNEIPARKYLMISPGWHRAALAEINRLVPKYRDLPYTAYYTGTDEPMIFPAAGPAEKTAFAKKLAATITATQGVAPPSSRTGPTTNPVEGLRWVAFHRYTGARFFNLRRQQVARIRQLDPNAVVSPNDYAFIDGFIPWDYTQVADYSDIVEVDPYVSYDEQKNPGRGRYNPGFATKLMADLTGKRVRTIVQAFKYGGYQPVPADVWTWTAQALRAGATDISLYAMDNPRFTNQPVYDAMLGISSSMRTARLPLPANDPATVLVYNTASEAQSQPNRSFAVRPRTRADQLYTAYAGLAELAGSSFVFDVDTRLAADPVRLARARTVWLPRAEVVDQALADALVRWVQGGGTLVVTDPDAFTRTPRNASLAATRDALIGAGVAPAGGGRVTIPVGGLGTSQTQAVDVAVTGAGQFTGVPAGAAIIGTNADGTPAVVSRTVGAGRVIAFASDPMFPATLDAPSGLSDLVRAIQRERGAPLDLAVWKYTLPGTPDPARPAWSGATKTLG